MNSLVFSSSLFLPPPPPFHPFHQSPPTPLLLHLQSHHPHTHPRLTSSRPSISPHCTSSQSTEEPLSVVSFEELVEKDWSFIDFPIPDSTSLEQNNQRLNQIISAANIEQTSNVLISIGSEDFVDRVIQSSNCQLVLVVHDSLFVLAGIKETHDDKVKCWQGEILYVPEKWGPFDAVFLYYLPGLPFELSQVFEAIAARSSPGARLVISHPQGREGVQQQRNEYPDMVVSNLPDKATLEKVATEHSFDITEFIDEPGFYLAVLKYKEGLSD